MNKPLNAAEQKRLQELSKIKYSTLSSLEFEELQFLGRKRAAYLNSIDIYDDINAKLSTKEEVHNSYMYT